MGTKEESTAYTSGLASALFGRTRLSILSKLFINDSKAFYLREIIRDLGLGRGSVQRELARLAEAGLILRSIRGNQVFFQANRESPIFQELKSLLVKTAGIADVVRASLSDLQSKIKVVFIYGSFVDGTDTAMSDIDLLVIGDVGLRKIVSALQGSQASIGREINPVIYSPSEFREKLIAGHHFVRSMCDTSKVFLIGSEDEFKKLVS